MKYYEDLEPGFAIEQGSETICKEEITEFAKAWDPQPFHIDEDAASESIFGDIIASGLHTLSVSNRLLHQGLLQELAIIAGRGIDRLRFNKPVFPGDTLSIGAEISERQSNESAPNRGLVRIRVDGFNQRQETVITYEVLSLVERQSASEP